jgi:acyl-CoA thioester hydrolase
MFTTEINLRVRYAETDRMGYVYYGNYATYFEVARVEALRTLGVTYKELEDSGILLPVVSFQIDYKSPAHYDDLLCIKTSIIALPSAKLSFAYETYRDNELLNTASTTLVFVDEQSSRPVRCPQWISEKLKHYFPA